MFSRTDGHQMQMGVWHWQLHGLALPELNRPSMLSN